MNKRQLKAGPGMHVEIELLSHSCSNERMAFDIVPDASADYSRGYMGEGTPLAKAIKGHGAGETVPYKMEALYAIKILNVEPSQETSLAELASERQARFSKVVQDAERANAVSFASSFSGKWGDYDPDSLPKDEDNDSADNRAAKK